MPTTLPPPALEHLCDLQVEVGEPVDAGVTPFGRRRFVPIVGGVVEGRLRGRVVPGGADFQLVVEDRIARLEASYMIELENGGKVLVRNQALRAASAEITGRILRGEPVDPGEVYFRGHVLLETGEPSWAWLNERQFLCVGQRLPTAVVMSFYVVA